MATLETLPGKPPTSDETQNTSQAQEDLFNNLSLSRENTILQSTYEHSEITNEKDIDLSKDSSFGGNECRSLSSEPTPPPSASEKQGNHPTTVLDSVNTQYASTNLSSTADIKDHLSSIPEELVAKIMKFLHPIHSTCLSLTAKKYYRIHKGVYPGKISLNEEEPWGIRLYHHLNGWMKARGFTFVALAAESPAGLWGRSEIWYFTQYFRIEDIEDSSCVEDWAAEYEKSHGGIDAWICQIGLNLDKSNPGDDDYEEWLMSHG